MAPRSVWNLGLRPQPARLLACSSHSRAISPPLIGQIARQSHLKSPHEPAASASASFQQRFVRRVGGRELGRVGKEREGAGGGGGGGTRVEPSRGESEEKPRGGLVRSPVNQMQPALDFPFPSRRSPSQGLVRGPGLSDPLIGWRPW